MLLPNSSLGSFAAKLPTQVGSLKTTMLGITFDPANLMPGNILGEDPNLDELADAIKAEQQIGTLVLALGVITSIIFLLIYITKLGAAGDDARARKTAITGILVAGIALALLGSLSAVLAFAGDFLH